MTDNQAPIHDWLNPTAAILRLLVFSDKLICMKHSE